ncbi:MAG: hypothetical protein IPL22_21835 [Bacteroidetes bacterium]|nr:hypothetical protein [Bacteroidota bacterium]MBK9045465.1 hypothetical protein [Bacteroidota bacterium]
MKQILYIFSLLLFLPSGISAQNQSLGQWKVHLPYNSAKKIADTGTKVYCASEKGLFYYNKQDNSIATLSKVTGLSEITISTIAYNPTYGCLVIAYTNANIDLIINNKIINISDIKRKNLTGDKNIYGIEFYNNIAYLSCGFGIVALDLDRREIKETYIIGPLGTEIQVFDVAIWNNFIFAATENGVYSASVTNPNLIDFSNWTITFNDSGNAGDCNMIEVFNNQVIMNYAKPGALNNNSNDEVYLYDGFSWTLAGGGFIQDNIKHFSLRASGGRLLVTNSYNLSIYDNNFNRIIYIDAGVYADAAPRDAVYDTDGILWIADNGSGMLRMTASLSYDFIMPDGPASDLVSAMQVVDKKLWMTHATRTAGWFNTYAPGNFSEYDNGDWKSYNNKTMPGSAINIGNFFDMMSVAIDPGNKNHVYVGSKGQGIIEMLNGVAIASYRDTNSTLQVGIGNPSQCQVVGMGFDSDNNLWALNSLAAKPVNVRTTAGNWRAFSIPDISGAPLFGDLTVDSYGQKWINVIGNNAPLGNGIAVFSDNGTLEDATDDKSRFISSGIGSGNLPSTDIRAITEDLENEIWLGTGKGVAVIYSPSAVLTSTNFDAQQILIKQDGINQYLLESEVVTAIAVDGANRKWIGTESGGVFLMSPDGTEQILNFNEVNSPLLSNYILSIAIDQESGVIYFGTNRGVISYKGDAIAGTGGCSDVLAYPNPVRPDYTGPIAIKGLVPNGSVKITDVSGNLIFETKSNGTQALWYGKNFKGEKAHTGVYLVFSTDEEGENTCVTKLLFIN